MGSFAEMRVDGDIEMSYGAIGEVLRSEQVGAILDAKGAAIAESMNAEDRGEFRSFPSDRGTRRRSFVVTYDRHAKRTANVDPAIFQRHV